METTGGIGLLFAGQGAQAVGMGRDLFEAFPEVRSLFARASEISGIDLAQVSFSGPLEELTRTEVSQPAIVTASLAALYVLRDRRPDLRPVAAAGLSLGEYPALVAAGVLEEEAALRLVTHRARAMQRACDSAAGSMASVLGMEPAEIEAVLGEVSTPEAPVGVSNYNAPGQTVISGAAQAVDRAARLLKERGARRVRALRVAGAYHSALMAPAAEALRPHLEAADYLEPAFPVFANATGEAYPSGGAATSLLERQVTGAVHWTDCLRGMAALGATTFYELGPGRVLSGLVRKTLNGATCRSLLDQASFEAAGLTEVTAR